jgi:Leucine-rich repeat (LRR) protein
MNQINPNLDNYSLFYLCEHNPSVWVPFSQVNNVARVIVSKCVLKADREIIRTFPSLFTKVDKATINEANAPKIFVRLIKSLHAEAERLDCDIKPEPEENIQSPLEQMIWECTHFNDLMKKIEVQREIVKAKDFNTFVEAVAQSIKVDIPKEMGPKKFWDDVLKNDENIQKIKSFSLLNKDLKFLPPQIALLSGLQSLYLGKNKLNELPSELASLQHLKLLNLSGNLIEEISPEFSPLSGLQQLELQNNQLKKIPQELASLSNLVYLDLSDNPLGEIPEAISSLSKLKYLYLNDIKLSKVSSSLTKLINLQELYLSGNQLEVIPKVFQTFIPKLKKLYLYRNPLTDATKSILDQIQVFHPLHLEIRYREVEVDENYYLEEGR